ncbi:MAG: protoporphyrinogen oxidase, partial [Chloroflexota bacterium]|nr:protoporphyrinogen oxidase [Chloroflexota bacterium]
SAVDATASTHVVVIGGGIAGLAAAHRLVQASPGVRITLIERDGRLGGKLLTERFDELVVEAGPDSFLSAKPRGIGLATELGLGDRLQHPTPRRHRAFVLRHGRLHPLPEGLSGLVPSRPWPVLTSGLLSPAGMLRFAGDLVLPARAGGDDESLASFVRRRLGGDAYDRLVEPLMAGIYAGDGDQLSLAATFPQLRAAELTHGSLIRGVLASKPVAAPGDVPAKPAFLAPAGGLAELVNALSPRLVTAGVDIRTNATASPIRHHDRGKRSLYVIELADGERLVADAIVLAAPAFAAGRLVTALDPVLASELRGIPHVSTAVVHLVFRRGQVTHPLDGHGYIIPRIEGRPALAATFVSEKWPGRAPADLVLLRVFLGRAGQQEILSGSDAELAGHARAEVAATLGVSGEPIFSTVHRWPWGMPQYVLGHLDRLARIEAAVNQHSGLALAGNAYRGVGIPDVIASGEAAASTISAYLREAFVLQSAS